MPACFLNAIFTNTCPPIQKIKSNCWSDRKILIVVYCNYNNETHSDFTVGQAFPDPPLPWSEVKLHDSGSMNGIEYFSFAY
jgi:hypothetical protein